MQPLITADTIIRLESYPVLYHLRLTHLCGCTEHIHVLLHSAVRHRFTQHKRFKLIESVCSCSSGRLAADNYTSADILLCQTTLHFSDSFSTLLMPQLILALWRLLTRQTPFIVSEVTFQLLSAELFGSKHSGYSGKHKERREASVNRLNSSLPLSLCFHVSPGQTRFTPTHAATNSCHRPNGHHAGSARVDGSMEHQFASGTGATGSSQTGAGLTGSTDEQSGHAHPREDPLGYPSCLDSTLQHIVRQLDILTQVSCGHSQKILNC